VATEARGCERTALVYGPMGERSTAPCTGPRGHESPCTFSIVPGRPGVYTLVPEGDAWWTRTRVGGALPHGPVAAP